MRYVLIVLVLLLASPCEAEDGGGLIGKIEDRLKKELVKRTSPGRSAPAAWCWSGGCDAGASGSVVRRESLILPGRHWTIDLLLGRETAGAGIGWELLPYRPPQEGEEGRLRVFLGPAAVTPWGEAAELNLALGIFASARW